MRFFEITEALTRRGFLGGLAGADAKQAQNSAAAQQAQQNLNQATQQLQQLQQTQPAPQPTADENQLNSIKQQVFNHVLRGIQTLYA